MELSDTLERELKKREILRLDREGLSVRLYDPRQVLILGLEHRRVGSKDIDIPIAVTFDLRSGNNFHSVDLQTVRKYNLGWSGGNAYQVNIFQEGMAWLQETLAAQGDDINKHLWVDPGSGYIEGTNPLRSYPELMPIVELLETHFKERAEADIEVPGGYLRLEVDSFNPEKAREDLKNHPNFLSPEEAISFNSPVLRIRPYHTSENELPYTTMEIYLFNPVHYQEFVNGTREVTHHFPSLIDWVFDLTYGRQPHIEGCPAWLHFNPWSFDSPHIEGEGLLDTKSSYFFMKLDQNLAKTIESMARLPLYFLIDQDMKYRENPEDFPNYLNGN